MKQLPGVFVFLMVAVSSLRATEVGSVVSSGLSGDSAIVASIVGWPEAASSSTVPNASSEPFQPKFSRSIWELVPDTDSTHNFQITLDELRFTWPKPGFTSSAAPQTAEAWESNLPHLSAAAFPQFNLANVPEPTTYALVGFGVLALVVYLKRR